MNLKTKALKKSLWVYHMSGGSCNNCDIEILDCLTPKFDLERFGIVLVGSPRHADVLLCTGIVNKKCVERVKRFMSRQPSPVWWWQSALALVRGVCSGIVMRWADR